VNGAGAIGMLARPVVAGTFLISGSSGELRGTLGFVADWALAGPSDGPEQAVTIRPVNNNARRIMIAAPWKKKARWHNVPFAARVARLPRRADRPISLANLYIAR